MAMMIAAWSRTALRRSLLGLIAFAILAVLAEGAGVIADDALPQAGFHKVVIVTAGGRHAFDVEVVSTPAARAKGLQNRRHLAADAGMLFDFKTVRPVAMWMADTFIPLDMLFIGPQGRIVNIARQTKPFSHDIIPSHGNVRAVLEINGGLSARLGIHPGDRVLHPIFTAPQDETKQP